jgi:hypothetical protein
LFDRERRFRIKIAVCEGGIGQAANGRGSGKRDERKRCEITPTNLPPPRKRVVGAADMVQAVASEFVEF